MLSQLIVVWLGVLLLLCTVQLTIATSLTGDKDATHLLVALKHRSPEQGKQLLHQLADVSSPLYGRYLKSHEEIALIWGTPSADEVAGFFKWFEKMDLTRSSPVTSATRARDFLHLDNLLLHDDVSLDKVVKLIEQHPLVEVVYVLKPRSLDSSPLSRGPIIRPARFGH